MNYVRDIPWGKADEITVIIEIPKGSNNKYEYSERGEYFKLDRSLYSAEFYPFDYGFMPQSREDDGDPLDIIVITSHPTFTGCMVKAKPIGLLKMEDENGIDVKIITVPITKIDPRSDEINDICDLPKHTKKEIEDFMKNYKRLEPHKWTKSEGFQNADKAKKFIKECVEEYKKELK